MLKMLATFQQLSFILCIIQSCFDLPASGKENTFSQTQNSTAQYAFKELNTFNIKWGGLLVV